MKKYDVAIIIGRFQPIHNGHASLLVKARNIAEKTIVLVGSANSAASPRNPFSYAEREHMIKMIDSTLEVQPLDDFIYEENQWVTSVQEAAIGYDKVCLVGYTKDDTSYYLKNFPQWDYVEADFHESIDSTSIRNFLYDRTLIFAKGALHNTTFVMLTRFCEADKFEELILERDFIDDYKKSWAASPFPPTFNTVDALVVQSGHILLVKRKYAPGKGLWAMPGGYIGESETQKDAMIRELREETKLKIPEPVLKGSIVKEQTFSNPSRDKRGRTFTQAFLVQLDNAQTLPKVKGSDDAEEAKFIPLVDFYNMPEEMYSDHYHIIRKLLDNM